MIGRHKWRILAFVAVSVAATVMVSSRRPPLYESTATIEAGQGATAAGDPRQFLETQAGLIQSDAVLRPVLQRFRIPAGDLEGSAAKPPLRLRNLRVTNPPNTSLLLISYRSADPNLSAAIANAIARGYIEETYRIAFRASAGISEFTAKQLAELKTKLEKSSAALTEFEQDLAAKDPERKSGILSARLVQLSAEYTGAQSDRMQHQPGQPEYQQAASREAMLKASIAQTKAEFDRLNSRLFEYKTLRHEAETDQGIYDELLRKNREAAANADLQQSPVRLADSARPSAVSVSPDVRLNGMLAFLFSTLLGIGAAVLADTTDRTVRDSRAVQRRLGADVLGSLPAVDPWRGRMLPVPQDRSGAAFEDAIRSLHDSILAATPAQRPRSLLVTSATPREGKTVTAVHLALSHSLRQRRTLLIDADLLRPAVHARLGLANVRGLAGVADGETGWRESLQTPGAFPALHVLTAGEGSRRTIERLAEALNRVLEEAEKEYDLILIDSPPLASPETYQMAAVVDGVVVIARAGQTSRKLLADSLTRLKRMRARVIGVALNETR